MSGKSVFIYSDSYQTYKFTEEHPFNPQRLRMTRDLICLLDLIKTEQLVTPAPSSVADLLLVHDETYVQAVMEASQMSTDSPESLLAYGLGTEDTPIFPNMHEATSLIVGGTVAAMNLVLRGEADHACNIAGGLHHAHRAQASGFCVYNDAAVAIAHAKMQNPSLKVAYIDTDAHHGDGVQWLFYKDPNVLTISFHETGKYLFPGTGDTTERGEGPGYGYSLNVPLQAFTEDESWMESMKTVLIPVLERFKPDIIISQHGCDGHRYDPLTHLCATTHLYRFIPKLIHRLAHEVCDGKWVAIGGGGYDIWRVVPRAWTMLWAEMSDQSLQAAIPKDWLDRWQPHAPSDLPDTFLDHAKDFPPIPRRKEIEEQNRIATRLALQGSPFVI
ncbi:acetoin utilization protein AcuC [Fodinisporobacter ferrooxydans]|uniref:Acetoin utilization protein AcuC n=1 Tax=Fodinisporobacter ferrooxydans TaxID=2901836 RepID=A0ABY4CI85_9BACL|nr:acetoin utilization protein AcuC [Alicyclobacillaceae bacterium MYW30-H2]